ncbi:MAG TPA: efflux RND transporter periplasmic adaptor subunit [Sorangium sp.]|nr:efflux RND transporter periplasmic adaptor subunit [Sorangium sp.]
MSVAAVAVALVGITALATVGVEHRIHRGQRGHDHREDDEHGEHGEHNDHVELSDEQLTEAGVVVAPASGGKVVVTIDLPGEIALNGEATAHVGPRVGGTVRAVKCKLGDVVNKGDVLAVLDSADVAQMHGEVQAARERLTLAKANYQRIKKLFDEKITSQKDYVAAKQAYAETKVALRSAQRGLRAKTGGSGNAGGYALVAPLSGTIVGWHIGVGEVLAEDARAFTIADLSSVWVNVTVYAKNLPRVRIGQRALVRAEGIEQPTEGRISYLSRTVQEITRSATARVVLEDPGEAWRPGLFVTAEVEVDEVEAHVVVAAEAVQRLEGKHVVFVRDGNELEARPVVLGRHGHSGEQRVVEIVSGLTPGELLVVKNSFIIKAELGKGSAGHEH